MSAAPAETVETPAEELSRLRVENAELRRLIAATLANTSAGMSRGFLRASYRPGFHPLVSDLEL